MEKYYRAALSMIPDLGPARMREILKVFPNSEAAWHGDLREVSALPTKILLEAVAIKKKVDPKALPDKFAKAGIRVVIIEDDEYPSLLKQIHLPPMLLYVKGSLEDISPAIAVVGARKCTSYGKNVAEKISEELSHAGVMILSGGARGIDTCAHRGALKAGKTVAILGSGVDIVYPPENRALFAQIAENGALVSEYPPGLPPVAGNFPARNRLLSGMSKGVLVIEAAEKSGSLITAHLALEQNREVFAIPGSILSETSSGTNRLIQQGAKLIMSGTDILEEFEIIRPKVKIEDKKEFTESEKLILSILKADEPMLLEMICQLSGLEWGEVSLILVELEIKGYAKSEGLHGYVRMVSL